ncbi:hypothetical protein [Undibacterium curvum]|uniref:SMODS and SLOG-associating 2TM effector domain-containing protein n=1 Tax=Undibacterium curvum TaxID=2762294 RepID=A0ABR7A6Z6_9BURK|nr:hypothetical protein [Undibacterium curvum]MBC3932617.1 hypothetical protein [Undibacterium curvum]
MDTLADHLWQRRCGLKLRALTNRFYYQERQRIFESREGMVKIISILGGTVAFTKLMDPLSIQICASLITVSSVMSLVFGFGNKARDSAKRSAEWARLDHDIELGGETNFVETDINQWAARCSEIESSEPAQHPGLFERSYLRACEALGSTPHESRFWRRIRPVILLH